MLERLRFFFNKGVKLSLENYAEDTAHCRFHLGKRLIIVHSDIGGQCAISTGATGNFCIVTLATSFLDGLA